MKSGKCGLGLGCSACLAYREFDPKNCQLSMVLCTYNPSTEKFKVILSYTVSLRLAWATRNYVSTFQTLVVELKCLNSN